MNLNLEDLRTAAQALETCIERADAETDPQTLAAARVTLWKLENIIEAVDIKFGRTYEVKLKFE